ncbi:thioesterase family protein [Nocardioides sp. W7]|uniref:acyl-CoA thioesterase n=1 Tax=Nocardioides sp. W7 TaxID=2931390 RepID=UPI001FD49530|nr:thioesterase family protein [Nocardioides sp. W7]
MRHTYECPLRWADLDLLGHVNNVVYVDYLQEARVDMLRTHRPTRPAGELVDGLVVVRHEVQYLLPLTFRFRPVTIECWVTEIRAASFTMAYEIFDADPEHPRGRRVYVRANTVLTPYVFSEERPRRLSRDERTLLADFLEPTEPVARPEPTPMRTSETGHYPVAVRFSDVDAYGHVNNVKYFEFLQEARISLMSRLWGDAWAAAGRAQVVVAQMDVDYRVPILFRPEPYDAWTWISHVGRTSTVVESEIRDGSVVLARARVVLVFFDPSTQRPTVPEPAVRGPLVAFAATES